MDLNELKELVGNGGKVVIVENGKPTLIVLPYEEYKSQRPQESNTRRPEAPPLESEPQGELTVDDLPL